MKTPNTKILSASAVLALLWFCNPSAFAASGNWNVDASGNWSVATNWSSNPTVPGTVAGDVVGLNYPITAARSVTLDVPATVGTLNLGSPASPFYGYTLLNSGGANLTLDNSGAGAQIVQATTGGAADVIAAPFSLNDNLTINNANSLTLSGVVSNSPSLSVVTIVKNGAGMLTLSGANTFVAGSVTINAGTLYLSKTAADPGTNGALGNVSGGGMIININPTATLSSGNNNWFGNQTLADSSLPVINITGGTLAITNNYTTIGALNMTNGATVTSTGTGSGSYYGFQFRGNVTSGGSSPSTISGSRDYHLNTATVFDVENTGGSPADLTVTANLRDQSGDFGNAAGGLTKNGPGTMMLSGSGLYSGETLINAGTLQIGDGTANNGYVAGYIDDEANLVFANPTDWTYTNFIVGAGNVVKTGAGTLTLSANNYYTGTTVVSNGVLNLAAAQSISGDMTVNNGATLTVSVPQSLSGAIMVDDGGTLAVTASQDATYLSSGNLTLGNTTGATLQFVLVGTNSVVLNPSAVTINGTATIHIASCPFALGVSYPLINNYSGGSLALVQPTGVDGELTTSGSTLYYTVTNLSLDVWTAAVNTNWDTTTANWTNSVGGNLFTTNYVVQFDDLAAGTSPLLVNITPSAVTPVSVIANNMTNSYVIGGAAIAGSGGLKMTGTNTLTLTGTNTFTGPISISSGTVAIGDAGQLGGGNYPGSIFNNAQLLYNSTAAQTLSGVISGSGSLVASNGTLTLSGANLYGGGTTNGNGTVVIGNNAAFGAGPITLAGGTIAWSAANYTVSNAIYAPTGTSSTLAEQGGYNTVFSGNITGGGNLTATASVGYGGAQLAGDNSGFTGTFTVNNNSQERFKFNSASAGSAGATWVFNSAGTDQQGFNFGTGTIHLGALSGGGYTRNDGGGTATVEIGELNNNCAFSGHFDNTSSGTEAILKAGTASLTLSGTSAYYGGTTIENGTLIAGANVAVNTSGPFGNTAGAIALGDATTISSPTAMNPQLLIGGTYTMALPITVGVNNNALGNPSTTFALGDTNITGTATLSGAIALNQSLIVTQAVGGTLILSGGITNASGNAVTVMFNNAGSITNSATPIGDGSAGGTVALVENGPGTLALSAANTYTGDTTVNDGTLLVNGSTSSGTVLVSGSGSILGGSGTIGGNTTVSNSAALTPSAGSASATTLTFGGNLTLTNASANFTLSTSALGSSDEVNYGSAGTLTLDGSDTINITCTTLDTSSDYPLFTSSGGTVNMTTPPTLKTNGVTVVPGLNTFVITQVGSSVVLHYAQAAAPPTVNSTSASPATLGHYQTTTVTVNVTPAAGQSVTNLSVTVDELGGAGDPVNLTGPGGSGTGDWTGVFTAPGSLLPGTYTIAGLAQQNDGTTAGWSVSLTVTNTGELWSGLGSDNKWSTSGNWTSGYAPGAGDAVTLAGATQTTNNLDFSVSPASLTFDVTAGNFVVTNAANTLTLLGGVTNSSTSVQTLDVPVALSGSQVINAASGNVALNKPVSGSGAGLTIVGSNTTVTLGGANSYTGGTTVGANTTLQLQNSNAVAGSVLTLNSSSTLSLGADADTTFKPAGLGGFIPNSTYDFQVNSINSPAGDGHTLTLNGQAGASTGNNSQTVTVNVSSSTGDALQFGSAAYHLSGGSGSAFGGNNNIFNLTNADVILNGLDDTAGNADCGLTLNSATGNSLTINGTVAWNSSRTIFAAVDSGVLNLNNTTGSNGGANWGFLVTLNGGTLNVNNAGAINNNNTQAHGNPDFYIYGGNLGNTSGRAVTLSANPTVGFYGDFAFAGTNDLDLGTGAVKLNASRQITVVTNTLTVGGAISDGGSGYSLTKIGSGTLILSGANTYTGGTFVNAGTLGVNSTQTGTTVTGTIHVSDGSTLQVTESGSGQLTPSVLNMGSSTGAILQFANVTNTTVAPLNLANLTLAGTLTINIQSVGGVGTYPLATNYTGETITLGTLPPLVSARLDTTTVPGQISLVVDSDPSVVWAAGTGNWDTSTANWKTNGTPTTYSDGENVIFDDTASNAGPYTVTVASKGVSPASITVSNSAKAYTITGGAIGGGTGLTKTGDGTLTLLGMTNTFAGTFAINGGTVAIDGNADLGAGAVSVQGTLSALQGFTLAHTLALGPVSASGNGTIGVGAGIALTNNTAMVNNGSGTGTLVKAGAGALQLGAVNTYSGGTVVSNGTLVLTVGGGTGTIRGALTIEPGASVRCTAVDALGYTSGQLVTPVNIYGGTLDDAAGGNEGYATTYNLMGGLMTNSVATDATHGFNFNGSSSGLNSLATNIVSIVSGNMVLRSAGLHINTAQGTVPGGIDLTISGIISGGYGFQKDGAGTLELTGANTYTGTTTVANGGLLVDGAGVMPGAVNVNSGAVFGGNGSVGGAVTVSVGGTLVPGTSAIGTLTVNNNLALAGDTLVKLDTGLARSNDMVNVSGTLAYGGILVVTNIGPALVAGDSFRIFKSGGTGTLSVSGNAGSGLAFSFTNGVLSVVAGVGPAGPGNLTNSYDAGTHVLSLSWPANQGWRLQVQTNSLSTGLSTNWTYITDGSISSTNIMVDPSKPTVFYRLRYP